ncbi:MAG: hypothetical protein Q8P67_26375 [archaeon]|nr:hypothetical protein [archaeon]
MRVGREARLGYFCLFLFGLEKEKAPKEEDQKVIRREGIIAFLVVGLLKKRAQKKAHPDLIFRAQ